VLLVPSRAAGVIKEEAVVKAGGAQALAAAVGRGDVKVAVHAGVEMFFFPSVRASEVKSFGSTSTLSRTKAVDQQGFDALASLVDEMAWSIRSTGEAELSRAAAGGALPEEVQSALARTIEDLGRCIKAAERALETLEKSGLEPARTAIDCSSRASPPARSPPTGSRC
jgi:dihydroxyacetone kinase